MNPKFSIVITTYNDWKMTTDLIISMMKWLNTWNHNYEMIVIDDHTEDERILDKLFDLKYVKIIRNDKNLGYTKTCNRVIRYCNGEIVVFLNNDMKLITNNWLDELYSSFREEETGIVGAKLLYRDNTIQHAGVIWSDRKAYHIYKRLPSDWIPANQKRFYSMVTGAFLAIRKKDFLDLGGFDEGFKNSAEDADLCIRMQKKGKKILYNPKIEFYHLEGMTYGLNKSFDNDNLKRLFEKHPDFNFQNNFWIEDGKQQHDPQFYPPYSIELGSGKTPEEGSHSHIDIMPDAKHLELQCDISKRLPFQDKTIKSIIANHVIEHISWRRVHEIFRDWNRVLVMNGEVRIRTPNLEFIIDKYNKKQTTPEAKQDEDCIRENFGGRISPAMYVNLKLFSGQDYPSNFHFACYDYETLEGIANRCGFKFSKERVGREYSPGEIQCVLRKIKDV